MANLFKNLVLSVVLRNGDAHRKNFGILYDSPASADCFLAPAYDIVTTACYIKDDTLALTLDGSKRWPSRKSLVRFGAERCFLSSRDAADIIEQVCDATASIRRKAEAGEFPLPPESAPVLKAMFAEWENGTR
jgi:serine/threonine-protein kinase HipA